MLLVSLVFLFVYLFGAYAYGAATLFTLRQIGPYWGGGPEPDASMRRMHRPGLLLFAVSTIWFVLHALIEFRDLTGYTRQGWLDLATFIVFLFPPAIMRMVFEETQADGRWTAAPIYRQLYRLMTPAFHLDTHVKLVQYIKLAEHIAYGAPEWVRSPRLPLAGAERESVMAVLNATVDALAERQPAQIRRTA